MQFSFEFWYLLPVSGLIATVAMSSGIGGAVFFSPLFMLLLKLEPSVAICAALVTQFFGFCSGVYVYLKKRLVDFKLSLNLLLFSIPAAIVGVIYGEALPAIVLKTIFALGLIFIGSQLFGSWRRDEKEKSNRDAKKDFDKDHDSLLIDAHGNEYRYTVCNKNMGRFFAVVGGAFLGMISVGLAELQDYHLIARCRVPLPVAVATSIFVVVITAMVASACHFYHFAFGAGKEVPNQVMSVLIFTVPGVIIGGQIGPTLQTRLNPDVIKAGLSALFVLIGLFMLVTLI